MEKTFWGKNKNSWLTGEKYCGKSVAKGSGCERQVEQVLPEARKKQQKLRMRETKCGNWRVVWLKRHCPNKEVNYERIWEAEERE